MRAALPYLNLVVSALAIVVMLVVIVGRMEDSEPTFKGHSQREWRSFTKDLDPETRVVAYRALCVIGGRQNQAIVENAVFDANPEVAQCVIGVEGGVSETRASRLRPGIVEQARQRHEQNDREETMINALRKELRGLPH